MLTPQEIADKTFIKALIGGYDMGTVDDFLEQLHADYSALYKDNAVLKSKLKVLVEKIEEYRATEDSMRLALITAQKTSEEITNEAQRRKAELLAEADNYVKRRRDELRSEFRAEKERLAEAKRQTNAFRKQVIALLDGERKFIEHLDELVFDVEEKPVPTPAPEAVAIPEAPVSAPTPKPEPMPEAPVEEPVPAEVPMPVEEPAQAAAAPAVPVVPPPVMPLTPPPVTPEPEETAFAPPQTAQPAPETDFSLEDMEEAVGAYLAQEVSGMMTEKPLTGTPQVPSSFFDDAVETVPLASSPAEETTGGMEEVEFYKLFDQDPVKPRAVPATPAASPAVSEDSFVREEPPAPSFAAPPKQDPRAAETLDIARTISATLGDPAELNVDIDAFWDDEGLPTTKRPKFDFENLQFGANYEEEDDE